MMWSREFKKQLYTFMQFRFKRACSAVLTWTCHCRELPGELERIMVWFRDYKIPDGKPPNAFGYDSKPMNSEFAEMVIAGTHNL